MCGIGLLVQQADFDWAHALAAISAAIAPRGPDGVSHITQTIGALRFLLVGSLLHLRGARTLQPVEDAQGNALCWNGEIFGGDLVVPEDVNDTRVLLDALATLEGAQIISLFARIEGPWAFVYWQQRTQTLWFGRDPFGRRSLLIKRSRAPSQDSPQEEPHWLLSSVGVTPLDDAQSADELEVASLYSYSFSDRIITSHPRWPFPTPNPLFVPRQRVEPTSSDLTDVQAAIRLAAGEFLRVLREAVRVRVTSLPLQRRVGILFSGGLDSSILAALTDQLLPPQLPIDLINVAFGPDPSVVPDRITAVAALRELRRLAPHRPWRLLAVNVTAADLEEHMPLIRRAMLPCTTVMDYTLAAAFYFAARGIGNVISSDSAVLEAAYKSDVSVLLMGNGADEQLAGYGRHRTRFNHGGWTGLQAELQKDTQRLWTRNLGRDDRIVSLFGREVRQPFLAEPLIRHINSIPLWLVCDLRQPRGVGDKQILREVALILGFRETASFPKRAVQFGSRIKLLISPKSPGDAKFSAGADQDDGGE